jgi:N-acetylneuraminic acid mutarotase
MLETALRRRRVRTVLIPATLLLFGLGVSSGPPLAAIQSSNQGSRQEGRPLTRSYHGAAVVNGRIYVIGGAGEDNKTFGSVQVYDPATGTWAARANMPTARGLFGTGAVGGTIYAIGGTTRGRDKLAVVEAYDTATDTWTRKADMPTPRNAVSAAVVDGKIYAIGGWGYDRPEGGWESIDRTATGQDFPTVEAYDPETDTWATRADMPTPRSHMTVSALGSKIYAIGGGARIVAGRSGEWLPLLEIYDTATNRWVRAADLPTPRSVMSSSVVDGRIYVLGGMIGRGSAASAEELLRTMRTLSVVEIYDPAGGRWTRGDDLATSRGWFSSSVVNGKVYVVGGQSLAPDAETPEVRRTFPGIEVYTPTRSSPTATTTAFMCRSPSGLELSSAARLNALRRPRSVPSAPALDELAARRVPGRAAVEGDLQPRTGLR